MKASSAETQFGRWRTLIWPIHSFELKKLFPMLVIFFLISFNYNVLRVMKDTLVVTGNVAGVEAIPFIKTWVMFPGAILMTYLFTRLSSKLSRETVFYIIMSIFLGFFFLFNFILYPFRDVIHLDTLGDFLQSTLPVGCKGLIVMVRNWSFSIFYAMSELWGNIVLFVLFWSFTNQVINVSEAKRFYGILGVGANVSGIVSGFIACVLSDHIFNPNLPFGNDAWEQSQFMLISLVLISGVITVAILRWMHCTVLKDNKEMKDAPVEEIRSKLTFKESFIYVWKSRYLLCIAVIVITYNVVINLTEVLWKHEVREVYSDPNSYNRYMNEITMFIGVLASLGSLLVYSNSIRKCGWTWTAMITPIVLLVTSIFFFGSYFFNQYFYAGSVELLPMVVFFGSMQNILSRGSKYSVFDATKEVSFVPLSSECKLKGKAAIDGVGSRLGKSGGSILQQGLFIAFGGLAASAPYIAFLLISMIGVWIIAVKALGKQFNSLVQKPEAAAPVPLFDGKTPEQQLA